MHGFQFNSVDEPDCQLCSAVKVGQISAYNYKVDVIIVSLLAIRKGKYSWLINGCQFHSRVHVLHLFINVYSIIQE